MTLDATLDPRLVLAAASTLARELGHQQTTAAHVVLATERLLPSLWAKLAPFGLDRDDVRALANPDQAGTKWIGTSAEDLVRAMAQCAYSGRHTWAESLLIAVAASADPQLQAMLAATGATPKDVLLLGNADPHTENADPHTPAADGAQPAAAAPTEVTTTPADLAAALAGRPTTPVAAALETFGADLLARARDGAFDPVIGRDRELERVVTILARRTKNNPVLVGEPGVGKTAVVEALAQAMAAGTVSDVLADRPLIELDLASMVSGAKMRGDFEERVKKALEEAERTRAVLFIDEIHMISKAGSTGGGADLAGLLKPALARGHVTVLGATTLEEYRTGIEADPALERRFQPVRVDAPTPEQTVTILTALAPRFEAHHGVRYTPAALRAAVTLTDRYVTDRHLPDKAIDALDEAGAAAAMAMSRAGTDRERYSRRCALRRGGAQAGAGQAAAAATREDQALTRALAGTDLGLVDDDAIAKVVSATTGLPLTRLDETGTAALLTLGERLAGRVIGQDHAVASVAAAVRRTRTGVASGTRPASFVFAGPTGVGKSELAKALADELFAGADGRGKLIQVDMGEYAEKASVARMFGAPPGYVGHDAGGQLTEAVRRTPNAVVLFDEVEKAHPEVFDALLHVLEDGRMTDGSGRVVDFRHTVIIMTTNLGAGARPSAGFGPAAATQASAAAATRKALGEHFRPEFLNRVDEVVVFTPLTRDDMVRVLGTMLAPLREQLSAKGLHLSVTEAAGRALLTAGWDPSMGARPLRRAIQRLLTDPIADLVVSGAAAAGDTLVADAEDGVHPVRVRVQARATLPCVSKTAVVSTVSAPC